MNLARAEYYFSDILSSMETRNTKDDEIITQRLLSKAQFGKDERAYDKYGDDFSITQKILPKIGGSGSEVLYILVELFNNLNNTKHKNSVYIEDDQIKAMENLCVRSEYKLSSEKILYMIRRFLRDGFTTFWQ